MEQLRTQRPLLQVWPETQGIVDEQVRLLKQVPSAVSHVWPVAQGTEGQDVRQYPEIHSPVEQGVEAEQAIKTLQAPSPVSQVWPFGQFPFADVHVLPAGHVQLIGEGDWHEPFTQLAPGPHVGEQAGPLAIAKIGFARESDRFKLKSPLLTIVERSTFRLLFES
jgi:hypothetical protein